MGPTVVILPLFDEKPSRPVADRLRPTKLDDAVGLDHLLAADAAAGPAGSSSSASAPPSCGPPGVGKTTITRLLADGSDMAFEPVSATFSLSRRGRTAPGRRW
ncbi:hypothetical protein [Streptomyces sp. NPDC000618]|uniref:hypothetical protein n=1 Tax=Streptomyces sp. NPDC000618 TaxID=3154265 RepID=UPI0033326963